MIALDRSVVLTSVGSCCELQHSVACHYQNPDASNDGCEVQSMHA